MKMTLLFLLSFSLHFYSQKLHFKYDSFESDSFAYNIKKLNKEVLLQYQDNNKARYYDNIIRLYILDEDYKKALFYLKELRKFPEYKDLNYKDVIGIQLELYALSKLNLSKVSYKQKYENIFNLKIDSVSDKSKVYLNDFFAYTESRLKDSIVRFMKTDIINDSISVNDAIKLCRYYISYNIAKETRNIAIPMIQKTISNNYDIKDSIIIKTSTGQEIALRIIRYKKSEPQSPIILNFSTYNIGQFNYKEQLNSMKGYTIVNAYSRGVYLSKDEINPFEFEVEDVNEVIDWIIKQPWSNGKVGMIGGSYDGFSQWAATKSLHPALKTIIPSASVGFGIDFPMYNNCFSPYMLRWLNYVKKETDYKLFNDEKKWLSLYNSYYKNGIAFNKLDSLLGKGNPIFQKWLMHPSFDTFWQSKIPYKKDFAKINIPVLTFTGYYDADQRGAMYYYNEHLKYNRNANHYLVIGLYSHSGVVSYIEEEYKGYKIDPVAKIDLEDISYQWFDYILKGNKKPEFLKDKVNYMVMGSNQWKAAPSIKKISNKSLKLYLNKTKLQDLKPELDYISQKIDFAKREDTMRSFDDDKILDNVIYAGDLKDKLIFESNTFDKPFEINGSFTGTLKASINKKDMDITITMYEKLPNGQYFKLSHEYFARASYAKNNSKRKLLRPNLIETVPVYNTFFTSRKIDRGSKIIVILGIRKNPDVQINYGTGKDVSEETIADAKEPLEIKWYNDSYIEIPIMKE
jgi:putative CocE/NonD family hydrolase